MVGPGKVFLVARVDLVGDAPEHEIGERLLRLEQELERRPAVARAVLTPAARGEAELS